MSDSTPRPTSRPIQSCFQCRKRKIKCNREYPCAPCLLRGEGETCREVNRDAASSSKTTLETLEDVTHRVSILEKTVERLSNHASFNDIASTSSKFTSPLKKPIEEKSAIRSSFGRTSTDEDVAMMLEDFAMGHRVNTTRATQDFDSPISATFPSDIYDLDTSRRHPLSLFIDPQINIVERLVSLLPEEGASRELIGFYFERLEWYTKVIHTPSFLRDSNKLFTQLATSTVNFNDISLPFLSLHLMVLCLAYHLIEPYICQRLGITLPESVELSRRMYNAAQACAYYDQFLARHSLEHLQCVVLMGVYQQNMDEADAHWALLGSAIKISQNLGMSQLGSESDKRMYSSTWGSTIRRETARRVWWHLIFNDWSHAAAHSGTYSVHPSQNHTGFPLNVNDVDIVDGQVLTERPSHEYTEMTLSLTRLRFVELYRQVVDNMQSPTGYSFVMDMDTKLADMLEGVAEYFDCGAGGTKGVKDLEITLSYIMGETRRLRLHRPYLFRGYKDRRYASSRTQCVQSARAILDHLKSGDEQRAILLKWWIVLFYGFAAAVVLFIDLCHLKADNSKDLDQRRAELREALDLFKTAEHISTVSRNAITLLEGLLNAEPELPSKPSRKRGAPEGDDGEPFERVVKKMIIDASKSSQSPSSTSQSSAISPAPSSTKSIPTAISATSGYPHLPYVWPHHPSSSDILSPGILFRDAGIFEGPSFDETTMHELSRLLYAEADETREFAAMGL